MEDIRPQGYIAGGFPALFLECGLPGRITDWNDDHQLIVLAMRGEDCARSLIIGEKSLDRIISEKLQGYARANYLQLAARALVGQPGSSAGGEHPKFAVFSEGRHVLVKFTGSDGAPADHVRDEVLNHALRSWSGLCKEQRLSVGFRRIAEGSQDTLALLMREPR